MAASNEIAPPDESVAAWVEQTVGAYRIVSRYAHDHGYSQLWRLETAAGDYCWLKCHQYPGKWACEVHALAHWAPAVGLSPRLLGYRSEPSAALFTELPGAAANETALEPEQEEALWQAAGVYLARLHRIGNDWLGAPLVDGSPQGEPQYDAAGFVRRSLESRLTQGRDQGLFDAAEQDFLAAGARDWTTALEGETPRAIHRDFGPRNWLTDADGTLTGVIDFEHARWDVRAADLNRWWDDTFVSKSHLAQAFFAGYGPLTDQLQAQIQALRLLQAASGVVWATQVGDEPYVRLNRAALRRLMTEA